MIAFAQRGAWGILVVLSGAILIDQTTDLLNPARPLDSSGLEEVDMSGFIPVSKTNVEAASSSDRSSVPLDTTGLRKVTPSIEKPDISYWGTPAQDVGRTPIDLGNAKRVASIAHGILSSDPSRRYVAPLSIRTAAGANYFVKLVDAITTTTVMTMYVTGGQPLSVSAPLGTYRLRYASGSYWRGERELFGSDTATAEADADFHFVETEDGYSGYEVELIRQRGGNLGTTYLSPDAF